MSAIALFISVTDIKESGWVDENVDDRIIRAAILDAQKIHTREMIGSGLYDELGTQKIAGTLTALNTTLLGYIKDELINWTLFEGIDAFNYKIRNKAIMTSNSDNSNAVDSDTVRKLGERFQNKAEYYDERLRRYLLQNQSSYPLYFSPGSGIDTIHPKQNPFSCNWVLDDKPKGGGYGDDEINRIENPGTYF